MVHHSIVEDLDGRASVVVVLRLEEIVQVRHGERRKTDPAAVSRSHRLAQEGRSLRQVQDARHVGGELSQVLFPWPDARLAAVVVHRLPVELRRDQQSGLAGHRVPDEGEMTRQGQADRDVIGVEEFDEVPRLEEVDVRAGTGELRQVLVRADDPDGRRPKRWRRARGVERDVSLLRVDDGTAEPSPLGGAPLALVLRLSSSVLPDGPAMQVTKGLAVRRA